MSKKIRANERDKNILVKIKNVLAIQTGRNMKVKDDKNAGDIYNEDLKIIYSG